MISKILWTGILAVVLFQGCAIAPPGPPPAPIEIPPAVQKPVETTRTTPLMMPRPPQPEQLPQQLPQQTEASSPALPDTAPTRSSSQVVVSLLDSASQYETRGQPGRAAAIIERGLRIAPKDAHLWLRLARIRLQQGLPQQAELLAKKSIRFAAGASGLLADNWLVIAEARGQQGDLNGVVEAREKAAQYQGY